MQIISLIFKTILGKGNIEERGYTSDTGENEKKENKWRKYLFFRIEYQEKKGRDKHQETWRANIARNLDHVDILLIERRENEF